jgi:hypothetical protein
MKDVKIDFDAGKSLSLIPRPEIHSLARLEGDLALNLAYCQQCQKISAVSSGGLSDLPIRGWYLDCKNRALEYAGMAIRDARNYEINAPASDYVYAIYNFFRPLLLSVASRLEPYRDAAKIRELLESPINEKIKEKKDLIKEEQMWKGPSARTSERISSLKEEIKALEEGKRTALLTTLFSEDMEGVANEFVKYVSKKGHAYANDLVSGMKREAVIEHLRKYKEVVYKPLLKVRESANEFIYYCSSQVTPGEDCPKYREKMLEAQRELSGVLEDRKKIDEEFKSGASFVLDVLIGILSVMSDEEFETVKKIGLDFVKKQLS